MNVNLYALLMSILAGFAIHLFFRFIRRHGPASASAQHEEQTGYLSVSDYVSSRPKRRLYYLFFRHLPPLIVTMLLCGLLNKLFPELWTLPYLFAATFTSVVFGSFREVFRKGTYLSERLVHLYNVVVINVLAVVTESFSHSDWLAAVTPSLEGIVDNIWSSLFVSLIVVAFIESSNKFSQPRSEERRVLVQRFVASSLTKIEERFGRHIDSLCGSDQLLKRLLRAILIFEDMNRPAWIRFSERVMVRIPRVQLTVGIAQVRADRPLSDFDSITRAHELLTSGAEPMDLRQDYAGQNERLRELIRRYNDGDKYLEDVLSVYRLVPVG
jgi:hypothetical protein